MKSTNIKFSLITPAGGVVVRERKLLSDGPVEIVNYKRFLVFKIIKPISDRHILAEYECHPDFHEVLRHHMKDKN